MPEPEQPLFCISNDSNRCKRGLKPITVVVLSFIAVILVGTVLLSLPFSSKEGPTSIIDAFFTATSATCVTGLVVKDTATHFSLFGQAVILFLIQIGGLGYLMVTTLFAMMIGKKLNFSHRMVMKANFNLSNPGGVFRFVKRVAFFVLIIEGIGALILFFRWLFLGFGFWKALKFGIFHSISAFNNAGFDVVGGFKSLTPYVADPFIILTISFLIILGGIGFIVLSNLYDVFFYKEKLNLHSKIVLFATLALIVIGTVFLFAFEYRNAATLGSFSTGGRISGAFFQSVSARTAGFNSIDIGGMTDDGLVTLIMLMFIGASPGGTGGGIKTVTFIIVLAAIMAFIKGKKETHLADRSIDEKLIMKSMSIFLLSLLIVIFSTLLLCAFNDFGFMKNIFEATSAFGTVGLSTGITPMLNTLSKITIALTEFIGRVGILSILFSLFTAKYINKVRLPREDLTVG